jgi:hypothetical protein
MRFRIKGAIKDTGEDVEVDIAATSDTEAMATASKLSLLVESVEPIIQMTPKMKAACQACGVEVEAHGVLRVVGEECFCLDCYGKHMGTLGVIAGIPHTRFSEAELKSLGVAVTYDKFHDKTLALAVRRGITIRSGGHYTNCHLGVQASFQGRVQSAAVDSVELALEFRSLKQVFPKRSQTDLILMVDERRAAVQIGEWSKEVERDPDGSTYIEQACTYVRQPLISELVLATVIEGKLGEVEMDLTDRLHSALGAVIQVVQIEGTAPPR